MNKPIKCFQRYSSQDRADRLASHRLGPRQKHTVGETYWIHPDVPGLAFPTRKRAIEAAKKAATAIALAA